MSEFESLFSFYGLLLGLALALAASGFADLWRKHGKIKAGVLIPLLGIVLVSAVTSNWYTAWVSRDGLLMHPGHLFTSLGVSLPLVFVGQAMFPDDPDKWSSLDDYYLENRKVLPAILLISPLTSLIYGVLAFGPIFLFNDLPRVVVVGLGLAILPFARKRWVHITGLTILAAGYFLRMMFAYWAQPPVS